MSRTTEEIRTLENLNDRFDEAVQKGMYGDAETVVKMLKVYGYDEDSKSLAAKLEDLKDSKDKTEDISVDDTVI